ncbi:MAG: TraR/DksA family transcriptional regulator [Elusimicrobia bacterium]|nr:TraR/DksA family transcriptional regulator [Elusimicrobiota bacterium]
MNQKELNTFKDLLLARKEAILKAIKNTKEEGKDYTTNEVGDSVDIASNSYEREVLFELTDNERKQLTDIDIALKNIEDKDFGICGDCGEKISSERLEAVPTATLCIGCQTKKDSK